MLTRKQKLSLVTAFTVLLSLAWAGCRGFFVNPTLTSITLSAPNGTTSGAVIVGSTLQLTAKGTYDDGSSKSNINGSVTWTSSNGAIATVKTGLVTGVSGAGSPPPSVTITASSGSATSGTANVTVFPGNLTGINISANPTTIQVSTTTQFTATGTFSGGSSATITDLVTWSSDNTGFVSINSSGLASGVAAGSANISASMTLNGTTTTSNSVLITVQ
jgi:hypothetical protein